MPAPASYWRLFLRSKLEEVVLGKIRAKKRDLKSEDTKIVMIVTQQRSEPPPSTIVLMKKKIDWSVEETQLLTLEYLFLAGKKLRATILFNYNYVEKGQPSTMSRSIKSKGLYHATNSHCAKHKAEFRRRIDWVTSYLAGRI